MISKELKRVFGLAVNYARAMKHEYITMDHIFLFAMQDEAISKVLKNLGIEIDELDSRLKGYIIENTPKYPEGEVNMDPLESISVTTMMENTIEYARLTGKIKINILDIFVAILKDEKSYATYLLKEQGLQKVDILEEISHGNEELDESDMDEMDEDLENQMGQPKRGEKKSALKENSTELVALAVEGKIDPVIGRDSEVKRLIEILGRRKKNNPILLGETGVGKTAIVEGLALEIADENVPEDLVGAKIFALDMGSMVAGTKYRGDFEKKLKTVLKEIQKIPKSVLFIDEIHQIIGAGSVGNSSMDASNLLKPLLSSGKLKCIGATTYEEYRADFTKDKEFSRRFAKVEVKEPSVEDSIVILHGLQEKYETFHNVTYTEEAVRLCVELSKK
ncbi:MAG TPA: AAA family ATPase, partial [Arcobacter sp.]|nr:AAA family ATPase [Arcobacter sp.]